LSAQGFEVLIASRPQWELLIEPRPNQRWFNIWLPWGLHDEAQKYALGNYLKSEFWGPLSVLRKAAAGSVGIDPRGDIRSVLMLYLLGCKRVITLSNYLGSDSVVPGWVAETIPFKNEARWQLNLRFLSHIKSGFNPKESSPPFLKHLSHRNAEERVALVPIAPWRGKWWPAERWRTLAEAFAQQGFKVVGLCGPGQQALIKEQLNSIEVAECKSVLDWVKELNRCDLAISVDSGPMHLADALRIPLIALFGQGILPLWAPSAPTSIVLTHRGDDFRICHPIDANIPLGKKYMDRITAEEVVNAGKRLLMKGAGPAQVSVAKL
jgi:ADP-heptose:LPS heptosyltransferase